jgi:hypothetical protein
MAIPSTLPSRTGNVDDAFTETWYNMRGEAIDNILDATPITAALKERGCFKTQDGGEFITRNILYGNYNDLVTGFKEGSTLQIAKNELETMAWWKWKYFEVPVMRSLIEDQKNSGPDKLQDYVEKRLTAARQGLIQKLEAIFLTSTLTATSYLNKDHNSAVTTDTMLPYGIDDYVPDTATTDFFNTTPYTYGNISRNNTWWQHIDYTATAASSSANQKGPKDGPYALTMYEDMTNAYNTATAHNESPNLLITTQTLFESFETFAVAKEQIVRDVNTNLANLGYDVLRFHGKQLIWTANMATNQMIMLNTDYFDVVHDPKMWFDMSEWRTPLNQMERAAFICCAMNCVGYQPRRNARIKWSA